MSAMRRQAALRQDENLPAGALKDQDEAPHLPEGMARARQAAPVFQPASCGDRQLASPSAPRHPLHQLPPSPGQLPHLGFPLLHVKAEQLGAWPAPSQEPGSRRASQPGDSTAAATTAAAAGTAPIPPGASSRQARAASRRTAEAAGREAAARGSASSSGTSTGAVQPAPRGSRLPRRARAGSTAAHPGGDASAADDFKLRWLGDAAVVMVGWPLASRLAIAPKCLPSKNNVGRGPAAAKELSLGEGGPSSIDTARFQPLALDCLPQPSLLGHSQLYVGIGEEFRPIQDTMNRLIYGLKLGMQAGVRRLLPAPPLPAEEGGDEEGWAPAGEKGGNKKKKEAAEELEPLYGLLLPAGSAVARADILSQQDVDLSMVAISIKRGGRACNLNGLYLPEGVLAAPHAELIGNMMAHLHSTPGTAHEVQAGVRRLAASQKAASGSPLSAAELSQVQVLAEVAVLVVVAVPSNLVKRKGDRLKDKLESIMSERCAARVPIRIDYSGKSPAVCAGEGVVCPVPPHPACLDMQALKVQAIGCWRPYSLG